MGNDYWRLYHPRCSRYFNPRSLVGNDQKLSIKHPERMISIHLPSWGTTRVEVLPYHTLGEFQSTFPRGERQVFKFNAFMSSLFQSTFPRGERLSSNRSFSCRRYFNPRSLVGNDDISYNSYRFPLVFQSTFPRGERLSNMVDNTSRINISIHVPSWGTTTH